MTINLPNQITIARLLLSIAFFAILSWTDAGRFADQRGLLAAAFWVFLVAALSDALDGILARRMGQVTTFGRIVDPVVDKVLVCGAFLYLASHHFHDPVQRVSLSYVEPWMVVLILTREMLVSALRAHSESRGVTFASDWLGKIKMVVQSATIGTVLGVLAWFHDQPGFILLAKTCVWVTTIVTALSAITYVRRSWSALFSRGALANLPAKPPPPGASPAPLQSANTQGRSKADSADAARVRGAAV
ncbi:MAG: CDP-diacylglycerol--glycerol-3-phosphate 3-phosphatidyltransferase [Phycisphaerales bacterium]|nr:CDP-diacylglycerol--glycerol-3-phosphate 3-phosphatidyltransferase [Phycisphaerales bacterium]